MQSKAERLRFKGASGQTLDARLDMPEGGARHFALFAHCFSCSKETLAAARISLALAHHGVAVLRFDFTGLGRSEGEFADTNFTTNVEDLLAATEFLRREYSAPALLIGHSLGGAAILAAAGEVPEAVAVATIGAPSDPTHVSKLISEHVDAIKTKGAARVEIGGRPFYIRRQFLEDIEKHDLSSRVAKLGRALMVFHSPVDSVVSIEHARHIFEAAKHPKSFVSLDDANHLLTRPADAVYVAAVLTAWASRYLREPALDAKEQGPAPSDGVLVRESWRGHLTEEILVGAHRLLADEPRDAGGNDTGPSPYEYLLAALGACTAMTLRLYAERKKIPLKRTLVRLSIDKIHAEDCRDCESREGKVDEIQREITLEGDLDIATRRRLMEIADKCPVHRTLTSEIKVRTRETD